MASGRPSPGNRTGRRRVSRANRANQATATGNEARARGRNAAATPHTGIPPWVPAWRCSQTVHLSVLDIREILGIYLQNPQTCLSIRAATARPRPEALKPGRTTSRRPQTLSPTRIKIHLMCLITPWLPGRHGGLPSDGPGHLAPLSRTLNQTCRFTCLGCPQR